MLPRRRFHPPEHFSVGIPVPVSHSLACGEMIFVGGQVDLTEDAEVTRPGDLAAQTGIAMSRIALLLEGQGADVEDLVFLRAFYVLREGSDEAALLRDIASYLPESSRPGPSVTLIPLAGLAFEGMEIEIEAIAMRGQNGERLARAAAWIEDGDPLPPAFSSALRVGEMIFTSAQTARAADGRVPFAGALGPQSRLVLDKLNRLLGQLGADLGDAVKTNVFNVEPGRMEDWKEAALIRASFFPEPGPAATGLCLQRLAQEDLMVRNDVIAMRGRDGRRLPRQAVWPDGHWDWPIHLPYRHGLRVGDMVFLGGQVALTSDARVVDPDDAAAQTATAMRNIERVLAELGLDMSHVMRVNAFYAGGIGAEELHRNVAVRARHYRPPGPTSTGVPMAYLAYEHMVIEIDVIAMV